MGWLTTALKVAQVAGQILSQLPAGQENGKSLDAEEPYRPGGVEAVWDVKNDAPFLRSVSENPVTLNFVDFIGEDGKGQSSTLVELTKKGQGFNPGKQFDFYRDGDLTIFDASPQSDGDGDPDWRYISFGVVLILGAVATAVAGGIAVGIRRTATTTELYIERRGQHLEEVHLNVQAGTLTTTFQGSDQDLSFQLPQGADLSRGAGVDGRMKVDEQTYQALVAPHRALVRELN